MKKYISISELSKKLDLVDPKNQKETKTKTKLPFWNFWGAPLDAPREALELDLGRFWAWSWKVPGAS